MALLSRSFISAATRSHLSSQRQIGRRLPSYPPSSPYPPSSQVQTFRTTTFRRATSPLFSLSALSHSRENQWLSKASGIALSEYSPQIHLLRAEAELAKRTSLPESTSFPAAISSASKSTTMNSSAQQSCASSELADVIGIHSSDGNIMRATDRPSTTNDGGLSDNSTLQTNVTTGSIGDTVHQQYVHEIRALELKLEKTTAALAAENKRYREIQGKRLTSSSNGEYLALWSVLGWGLCVVLGWREMNRWGTSRTTAEYSGQLEAVRPRSSELGNGIGDSLKLYTDRRALQCESSTVEEARRFGRGWFWADSL